VGLFKKLAVCLVIKLRGAGMARKTDKDSKGPGEFLSFALEELPDEFWPVSIVIGVVFGLVWLLGAVFRSFFGE
jgi:hypothetical protein